MNSDDMVVVLSGPDTWNSCPYLLCLGSQFHSFLMHHLNRKESHDRLNRINYAEILSLELNKINISNKQRMPKKLSQKDPLDDFRRRVFARTRFTTLYKT